MKLRMTPAEILSNSLSVIAIIISFVAWRTSDTRIKEVRDKRLSYYVSGSGSEIERIERTNMRPVKGRHNRRVEDYGSQDFETAIEYVDFGIVNTGVLPIKDVDIAISTRDVENK